MKKIIVGLMGFLLVGAMALPVAAQGRKSNRDDQTTNFRRDSTQRNDVGFSRGNNDQRDSRYDVERRRQNEDDNFSRRNSSEQRDRQSIRLNDSTFLKLLLRH
jgi:hypothetical protein